MRSCIVYMFAYAPGREMRRCGGILEFERNVADAALVRRAACTVIASIAHRCKEFDLLTTMAADVSKVKSTLEVASICFCFV